MSNHLRDNDDATRETTSPFRRRRLWLATGVVGLTGAVSLAGVAYATTSATGTHRTDLKRSTAQQITSDGATSGDQNAQDQARPDGKARGGAEGGEVREVPCDEKELVKALDLANRNAGGTLKLAKDCTYELDRFDKKSGTGLPTIKQDITIEGNGSTIERDSKDAFRIFRVAKDGDLTLKDLTVSSGTASESKHKHKDGPPASTTQAAPPSKHPHDHRADGGGLLVERGGQAVLKETVFTRNSASGNGGAIANFGHVEAENTAVDDNHAGRNGGGIFNAGALKVTGAGKAESLISNNTAGENGGGIANGEGKHKPKPKPKDGKKDHDGRHDDGKAGTVTVENTRIEGNFAGKSGGGIFSSGGTVHVTASSIKNNTACENGGGVYAADTHLLLTDVIVEKNHARKDGGGVYNTSTERKKNDTLRHDKKKDKGGQATITASEILGNSAGRFGGGIFNGEAKDEKKNDADGEKKNKATLTLRDSTVKDNFAGQNGGGIFNNKGTVTLINTSVTENKAHITGKDHHVAGGIVNVPPGTVTLDATSFVNNNDPKDCVNVPGCDH